MRESESILIYNRAFKKPVIRREARGPGETSVFIAVLGDTFLNARKGENYGEEQESLANEGAILLCLKKRARGIAEFLHPRQMCPPGYTKKEGL